MFFCLAFAMPLCVSQRSAHHIHFDMIMYDIFRVFFFAVKNEFLSLHVR